MRMYIVHVLGTLLFSIVLAACATFLDHLPYIGRTPYDSGPPSELKFVANKIWRSSPTIRPPAFRDWATPYQPISEFTGPPTYSPHGRLFLGNNSAIGIADPTVRVPVIALAHAAICAFTLWLVCRVGRPRLDSRGATPTPWDFSLTACSIAIFATPIPMVGTLISHFWLDVEIGCVQTLAVSGLDNSSFAHNFIWSAGVLAYLGVAWIISRSVGTRRARIEAHQTPRLDAAAHCLTCSYPIGHAATCPECGSLDPRQLPPALYMPWELRLRGRFTRYLPRLLFWTILVSLYCAPWILGTIRSILQ